MRPVPLSIHSRNEVSTQILCEIEQWNIREQKPIAMAYIASFIQ